MICYLVLFKKNEIKLETCYENIRFIFDQKIRA